MFRFSDNELFPFPCARCGEKIEETVGRMKANRSARCPECGARNWFYHETFLRALDKAERAINDFGRDIRFGKQDP